MTVLASALEAVPRLTTVQVQGTVASVRGLRILVDDLPLPVGSLVRIGHDASVAESPAQPRAGSMDVFTLGEIVGFDGSRSIVMTLAGGTGIAPGMPVVGLHAAPMVAAGGSMLGRVVNGLAEPVDGLGPIRETVPRLLSPAPLPAMRRRRIVEPMPTGVAVVDGMLTLGRGQRIGVFSGPGVGKSTLLSSIARNTSADVSVIALIGERGREVKDFIEDALGPDGLARSVIVTATSDESPLMRVRAALTACSIAEHFRDLGQDVLLMMDSITRFAQAQRQIGLTAGEQPATKGYPPSVFSALPVLLERAGSIEGSGSITGIYSVLVEGDDLAEPISDAARGVLDGHIALSRKLAGRGHFPAVDLQESISRVADDVCDQHHVAARREVLKLVAAYAEAEELITIGAYARGSNPTCDVAIAMKPAIEAFVQQNSRTRRPYPETCRALLQLAADAQERRKAIEASKARPASSSAAEAVRKGS